MDISFLDVLLTVFSLVLLAVPGFLFAKLKMLPKNASETISTIALYGCQTLLVFTSFQSTSFNSDIAINMLIVAGLAFAVHFIMIGVVYLSTLKAEVSVKLRCVRYAGVFSNCGFMGLPFLKALFDGTPFASEILIYGAVVMSVFNILNWTFGVFMMTGDRKQVSVKKILLNPVIIAVVLGFLFFVTIKKPFVDLAPVGSVGDDIIEKIMYSVTVIGDMVTPLSMTVIGIRLANVNMKQLFLDKWAYVASALKLLAMSVISILIPVFLPVALSVKYAIFFLLSMPAATSTAMFAVQFGGDGDSASVMVILSTILSIVTIPLMFLLYTGVFGTFLV